MKKSLYAILAGVALVAIPTAAHADDAPPAPTDPVQVWDADDDLTDPYLDCVHALWLKDVRHHHAEETSPGVWGDETITYLTVTIGAATGDQADADCPNWQTDDDGNWSDVDAPETPVPDGTGGPIVIQAPIDNGPTLKRGING